MNNKLIHYLILMMCMACAANVKMKKQYTATATQKKDTIIMIQNSFNSDEVSWFNNAGKGTIKGIAKFKSKTGEVHYGKEFRIELMPFSLYTQERLNHLYPNKKSGYIFIQDGVPKFTPDPEGYHATKKTMCNAKGEFEFTGLPAGEYYVIAFMIWDVPSNNGNAIKDGGGIMQRITLDNGKLGIVEMSNF
jgi:hypothetical protein